MQSMFESVASYASTINSITLSEFPAGFGQSATNMSSMFRWFASSILSFQPINIYWSKTDMSNFDSRTGANKTYMFSDFGALVPSADATMYTFSQNSTNVFKTNTAWTINKPKFIPNS